MENNDSLPVEPDYKRKPNFTDMEKLFLLQQYGFYKPILSSRLCDAETTRQKQETWHIISNGLNQQRPSIERTAKEVKKKWENLATMARKEISDFRNGSGRSLLRPPSALTLKILELLDDISFNPALSMSPNGTNGSFLSHIKEELWDDETDSNDISPHSSAYDSSAAVSNSYSAEIPLPQLQSLPPPPVCTFNNFDEEPRERKQANRSPLPSNSQISGNNSRSRSSQDEFTFAISSTRSIAEPISNRKICNAPNSVPLINSTSAAIARHADDNYEPEFIKRRKVDLETERMVLENEKLKIELEILKEKLKIMKQSRHGERLDEADFNF